GIKIAKELRQQGIHTELNHGNRSVKAQFKYANKLNCNYVITIGEDELKSSILKSVEYLLNEIFHNASSKKIVFNYKGNMYKYNISDVYVVAFKGNYVYITIENKTFKIRSDLQKYHFEKKLLNFLFVDHGTIINGDKVQHINTQDQFIILDNEKRIECSKQGVKNIKKYIYSNYNDKYK
ncbi:MAG: LytTR family transcriptional regulator DNA-binding domain-containing protein, partial [Longicatena sp.]